MKPGARRAEDESDEDWSWLNPTPVIGAAESGGDHPASSFVGVAAVLWVPDPEQRHGWREVYVRRGSEVKPGGTLGFRKP